MVVFFGSAARAEEELLGPGQMDWVRRLERDRYNLVRVLRRLEENGDGEGLLRLAGATRWYWMITREIGPGKAWLEEALTYREGASPITVAAALNGLGVLAIRLASRDAPDRVTSVVAAAGSFAAISSLLGSPLIAAFLLLEAAGLAGPMLGIVEQAFRAEKRVHGDGTT